MSFCVFYLCPFVDGFLWNADFFSWRSWRLGVLAVKFFNAKGAKAQSPVLLAVGYWLLAFSEFFLFHRVTQCYTQCFTVKKVRA